MRIRSLLGLGVLLAACGTVTTPIDATSDPDAGTVLNDAAQSDAATADGGCSRNFECADEDLCTTDVCHDGACTHDRNPMCGMACTTDQECEDADPVAHGYCHPIFRGCIVTECITDAHCDDSDPCTLDYCLSMDSCRHTDNHLCCTVDSECGDPYECTIDTCGDDGMCQFTPTPACIPCTDNDHDGSGPIFCGGTDCDDFDPTRSASATEICDNAIDDDCDGAADVADSACRPDYFSCDGALALTPGTPMHGVTLTPMGATGCGGSAFFTLALAETSDVEVTVELERPPTSPGGGLMGINYRAFLESSCGDSSVDLFGGGTGSCNYWDPAGTIFSGAQSTTYAHRRVPAGTYTVEVKVGPMFTFTMATHRFTVTARTSPSAAAVCDGAALSTSVRGNTEGGADAWGVLCDGSVRVSPERVHPFTLASRSAVRVRAAADASGAPMRVEILDRCDAAALRLGCQQSYSSCQPEAAIERVLDAGTYYALVERTDGAPAEYTLTLETQAEGAACEGAAAITNSGMYSGTTLGGVDRFRDPNFCGGGMGPDVVYRLDLAARTRVVLDLITSYDGGEVRITTSCGETWIDGRDETHIDTMLEAGSYQVVVGGQRAENAGAYVLSATLL